MNNKTTSANSDNNDRFDEVAKAVTSIYHDTYKTGKLIAGLIDKDKTWKARFLADFPEISDSLISKLEKVGRDIWHPKVAISDCAGYRRLRTLPYAVQEKYVTESVPWYFKNKGNWEPLLMNVLDLNRDQAKQVFDKDGVRNEAEQRSYIELKEREDSLPKVPSAVPYRIRGKKLFVSTACEFTEQDLKRILLEMGS